MMEDALCTYILLRLYVRPIMRSVIFFKWTIFLAYYTISRSNLSQAKVVIATVER